MKLWMYKHNGLLKPASSEDKDKLKHMPNGEPFQIKYVEIRNVKHHRKYFSFINAVYENLPEKFDSHWPDADSFRRGMQMYAGYFIETVSLKGERHLQPKSIAFDKLDETAFSELHNKVKTVIGTHIMPDMDMDSFEMISEHFY